MKIKIDKSSILNIIILFTIILLVIILPNKLSSLKILGIYNIMISILMVIRHHNNKPYAFLMGIIALINISYSSSVCINTLENVRTWQFSLYYLPENIINVKSYSLFITFLLLSFKKCDTNAKLNIYNYNPIIYLGCYIILIYTLVFGIDRSTISTYVSNSNVLYEYAIVIYVLAWCFSGDRKLSKAFLLFFSLLYCLQGLMYGDRSSAFPMIIVNILLLFQNKIDLKKVLIIGICGIMFGNFIDIYRNDSNITINTFNEIANRGLNVNTISFSSYAGTQIIRYSERNNIKERNIHFMRYVTSLFKGRTSKLALSDAAKENGFENKGGGMTSSYFYFWFGYLGAIFGGIIIGKTINSIYKKSNNQLYCIISILISAFSIRWILYYPSAFFRTSIIIPMLGYVAFKIFHNIVGKKPIFLGLTNKGEAL